MSLREGPGVRSGAHLRVRLGRRQLERTGLGAGDFAGRSLTVGVCVTLLMLLATFAQYVIGTVAVFAGADTQAVFRAENIAQYTAIMFSAAGFGSVFVGRLVDRTRLQFLAFLLTGLAGSCLLLVGFVTSATSLVALCAVIGLVLSLANPLTNRIVSGHVLPQHRAGVIGWKSVGPQLGALGAGVIFGAAGSLLTWQMTNTVLAAILTFGTGLFVWSLSRVVRAAQPSAGRWSGSQAARVRQDSDLRSSTVTRSAVVWYLAVFSFLTGGAIASVGAFIPLYAKEVHAFDAETAALLGSIAALSSIFGRLVWVNACKSFPSVRVLSLATAAAVGASGLLMLSPNFGPWFLWTCVALLGGTALGMSPLVHVIIVELVPFHCVGQASGMVGVGMFAGFAAQPLIMGHLIAQLDFTQSWGVVVVSNILGLGIILAYPAAARRSVRTEGVT